MITMIDQIYDRDFQVGRTELNKGLMAFAYGLRNAIAPALSAVHHFEWDAPWNVSRNSRAKA